MKHSRLNHSSRLKIASLIRELRAIPNNYLTTKESRQFTKAYAKRYKQTLIDFQ